MLSRQEANRFRKEMQRELESDRGALVRCAAGLVAVICVVVLGTAPLPEANVASLSGQATQTVDDR